MKGIFIMLVFALSMISCNLLYAQRNLRIKAGVGISNARAINPVELSVNEWTSGNNYVSIARFYGGVSTLFKLSNSFFVEPELAYLGMGFDYTVDAVNGNRFDYLSLPINLTYRANDRLNVSIGPYVSYLMDNMSDTRKDIDAGLQLGSEFRIYKGCGIGARYFHGLVNVNTSITDFENYELYNRSIQFYIFYQLKVGKRKSE